MQKLKNLNLFILSFLFSLQIVAQTAEFDSLVFFDEVKSTISSSDKSSYKDLLNDFENVWFGSKLTPEERKQLSNTAQLILEKKLPVRPDYISYIQAVVNLKSNDSINVDFSGWNLIVDEILNSRRRRNLRPFLNTSKTLFKSQHLSEVGSVSWGVNTSNYSFELKNNKPIISFEKECAVEKIKSAKLVIIILNLFM